MDRIKHRERSNSQEAAPKKRNEKTLMKFMSKFGKHCGLRRVSSQEFTVRRVDDGGAAGLFEDLTQQDAHQ